MAHVTSYAPGNFCWIELGTSDAASAKEFYTRLFDWTTNDIPMGDDVYTILMKNGESVAAVYQTDKMPPAWLTYMSVESADDAAKTAKDLGANVIGGPLDVADAGRMAFLSDPQGVQFAVWEAKKHIGARLNNEPNTLTWSELATTDEDAASAFYTSLFGWKAKAGQGAEKMKYTEFYLGDRAIGGMYKLKPEMQGVPPHWMPYISVADCDATVAMAQQLGGSVMMPAMDIPGVGRFSVIRDPQGAAISVITLAR